MKKQEKGRKNRKQNPNMGYEIRKSVNAGAESVEKGDHF